MGEARAKRAQDGHRRRVWAALACAAGIGAAIAALLSTADALFLSRVGSRHLGTGYAVSSAVSMAILWGVGAMADRRDRARLLWLGSWAAVALIAFVLLASVEFPRLSAAVLLVAGKQIGGSLELLLWVVIAARFTAREARRLLPWVIVANGAGGTLGAISVGPLAHEFGATGPLWTAGVLLIFAGVAARALQYAPDFRIAQRRITRVRSSLWSGVSVLRERPLARWLAILVATAGIFAPMMYYLLGVSAAAEYTSEVELAGFLGRYRAYVQGAALVAQVAIAPWLAQRLGVGLMMLLAPLAAIVVALWVGLQGGLLVVLLAQAATRIFDTAIQNPAEQLIQNLLPQEVRGRVAGVVGGVAKRSGAILGGLAASFLVVWPTLFSLALICAAAAWLVAAVLLWRRFSTLAVAELSSSASSNKMATTEVALRFADERGLRQLRVRLVSTEKREHENAVALLRRLAGIGKVDAIAELLRAMQESPQQAQQLCEAIHFALGDNPKPNAAALDRASSLLGSENPHEQGAALAVLGCASLNEEQARLIRQVRAADPESLLAAIALARQERGSVLAVLRGAGHTAEVVHGLRCEIARALAGRSADSPDDLAERLLRSVARCAVPELQVSGMDSVVKALAAMGDSAIQVLLAARLLELSERWRSSKDPILREASLVAMRAGGSEDLRRLIAALGDRDDAVRRQAETLLREAGDAALEVLSIASQSGRRRVRLAAVDILADLRPSKEALDQLLERELIEMARCSQTSLALQDLPQSHLVRRRLGERIDEAVEAALMALEAGSSGSGDIGEVARRLARAASDRSRARALEALDALLPRRIARTMLGAMEGTLDGTLGHTEAVEAELAGRDRLTRDLLVQALGSEGRANFRDSIAQAASAAVHRVDPLALVERLVASDGDTVRVDVPSILETIVALSELALFADLSTVQLEELATAVQWQGLAKGETLMEQGEEAHCMYFVRSGRLKILVDGAEIAELVRGEPVGELALFAEDRRTASVVAASDSQLGMVTREDIENLVEEVPGIALKLCRAMSRRLAESNRKSVAAGES